MATASRGASSKPIVVGYIGLGGTHEPCDTLLAFEKTFLHQLLLVLEPKLAIVALHSLGQHNWLK